MKSLGDWIQILASVGVIGGVAALVLVAAYTQLLTSDREQSTFPDKSAAQSAAQRAHPGEAPAEVTKERQSELREFVLNNCPACHGAQMVGSIGPPLFRVDLERLSISAVASTIRFGRTDKGMPAWEEQLSERDAYWMAGLLKREGILEQPVSNDARDGHRALR